MQETAPSNPIPTLPGISIPKGLHPPIDMSKVTKEEGVKKVVKALLAAHGWFSWMPAANGYGAQGVHDFLALKDAVFITVETKFGRNKPSTLQKRFAMQIIANDCYSFCVNETNIDHFAWWLESFELSKQHQMMGQDVPQEHGSRLLNAISALTDLFAEED